MKRQAYGTLEYQPVSKRARSLAVTQEVQREVNKALRKKMDFKYTDVGIINQNITSSGTITSLLSNLARGDDGHDNFEGNQITPQGLTVKYYAETNQTFNACRVMIFQWNDSSTPALSGILQNTAVGTAIVSPTLVTNKPLIKVLYDKHWVFAPCDPNGGFAVFQDTIYIPGKRLRKVDFNSTTAVVQKNNIYVLYISDDFISTYPHLTFWARTTFSDTL